MENDNRNDIDAWQFRQIMNMKRGSPRDAFEFGLMWSHPNGKGVSALYSDGSTTEHIVWPNTSIGKSRVGLMFQTQPVSGEALLSLMARGASALAAVFGSEPDTDLTGAVSDPRLAFAPAPAQEKKEEQKQEERKEEPPPPPPPAEPPPPPDEPVLAVVVPGVSAEGTSSEGAA